jgi:hypothetical protein
MDGYRLAYVGSAVFALIGGVFALRVPDADAAATMVLAPRRKRASRIQRQANM